MTKQEIFNNRLRECDTSVDNICQKLSNEGNIYAYITQFDGLGNKDSDLDIYCITKRDIIHNVKMIKINGANCDIENWSIDSILRIIEKGEYLEDLFILKLLSKIQSSICIRESEDMQFLLQKIDEIDIQSILEKLYKKCARAEYDDAVKMLNNCEFIPAIACARRSSSFLLGAINAHNRYKICNIKWNEKIYLSSNDSETIKDYVDSFIYCEINESNIKSKIEKMLRFISNNINSVEFF